MSFERKPIPGLDPATLVELRAALTRSLQSGAHDDELKVLLRRLAAQARERGIQAEQMLIALKDVWHSLPELPPRPGNEVQVALLQQLVSHCIQEYYSC